MSGNKESESKTPPSISIETSRNYAVKAERPTCLVLELEDINFNSDSAVFIPQERVEPAASQDQKPQDILFSNTSLKDEMAKYHPEFAEKWYQQDAQAESEGTADPAADPGKQPKFTNLHILVNVYKTLEKQAELKLLIAGHTDTAGSESHNQILSEDRAKSIVCLLTGDRDGWIQIVRQRSKVEDYQSILQYFQARKGWDCSPGPIDNQPGEMTKAAVKSFQAQYNKKFNAEIKTDGVMGEETWGAVFAVYMQELEQLSGSKDQLEALRKNLRWVDEADPVLACGEKYPLDKAGKDNYRSRENRRVEFLFFKTGEEPAADSAAEKIYASRAYKLKFLKPEDISAATFESEAWGDVTFSEIEEKPDTGEDFDGPDYQTEYALASESEEDDPWAFLAAYAPPAVEAEQDSSLHLLA